AHGIIAIVPLPITGGIGGAWRRKSGKTRLAANHIGRTERRSSAYSVQHAERMHVGLENSLVLAPFIGILLAQPPDRAQPFDVEAVRLSLGVDVANVIADRFFLFFQLFDALDESLQVIFCKATRRPFLSGGSGHETLLVRLDAQSFLERERQGQDERRVIP